MGIEWYTGSDVEPTSAVDVNDTPHASPVHSILFHRGSAHFQTAVFALHAAVAALFASGHCTVVTAPALWVSTMAMHGRNEGFNDGSDKLFRNVLLLMCTLPLQGAFVWQPPWRWWWGGCHVRSKTVSVLGNSCNSVRGAGAAGLSLQLVLMYLGTVAHRWRRGPGWWPSRGTAVFYAVNGAFGATPFASGVVAGYPSITYAMTMGAIVGEIAVPIVLLASDGMPRLRTAAVVAALVLQASIQTLFHLPQWGIIASAVALVYLPTQVMDILCGSSPLVLPRPRPTASPTPRAQRALAETTGGAAVAGAQRRRGNSRGVSVGVEHARTSKSGVLRATQSSPVCISGVHCPGFTCCLLLVSC
jgi:hypothetical protein